MQGLCAFFFLSLGILLRRWVFQVDLPFIDASFLIWLPLCLCICGIIFNKKLCKFLFFCFAGFIAVHFQKQSFDHTINLFRGKEMVYGYAHSISEGLFVSGSYKWYAMVQWIHSNTDTIYCKNTRIVCSYNQPIPSMNSFHFKGIVDIPRPPRNPSSFDSYNYCMATGIHGFVNIVEIMDCTERRSFFESIILMIRTRVIEAGKRIPMQEIQGLFIALFLGERDCIPQCIQQDFQRAGLTHLLALSGLNIIIIVSSLHVVLSLVSVPRSIRLGMLICIICIYTAATGWIPSLVRATSMACVMLSALLIQRISFSMNALGIAGIILLLVSPASISDPGFQLSFSATAGLIILTPKFFSVLPLLRVSNQLLASSIQAVLSTLLVSVLCFCTTFPIIAYHFGYVSLFGLLANTLVIPVMTIAMNTIGLTVLSHGWFEPLASISTTITTHLLQLLNAIAHSATAIPWALIWIAKPQRAELIATILFLTGYALIRKQFIGYYSLIAGVLMICIHFTLHIAQTYSRSSQVACFNLKHCSLIGIGLPNGTPLLIKESGFFPSLKEFSRDVAPWIRTFHNKHESIWILSSFSVQEQNTILEYPDYFLPKKLILSTHDSTTVQSNTFCSAQTSVCFTRHSVPISLLPLCTAQVTQRIGIHNSDSKETDIYITIPSFRISSHSTHCMNHSPKKTADSGNMVIVIENQQQHTVLKTYSPILCKSLLNHDSAFFIRLDPTHTPAIITDSGRN